MTNKVTLRVSADGAPTARRKAVWGSRVRMGAALMLLAAAPLAGCSQVRQGQAASYLIMTTLTGTNGCPGATNASGSVLLSDVQCGTPPNAGAVNDPGSATLQLQLKDPQGSPSPNNFITVTQYHVQYQRSDGHNIEGVDVPYAFDGALTVTVSDSATVGFTLVRLQAKHEAPLAAIAANSLPMTMIATVTFYGHDQTGREVSVSGNIEITFDNFVS